ncbi:MAG: eamA-like transporter family protein [Frankiales bacterium]|nr:eamA-like transporter family protein [Frankiales bacterium]
MTRRGWVLFFAMALIWGIPYLLIKFAVAEVTPVFVVFFRTAVGAALLLPIAAHRGELRGLGRHWRPLLAFAVIEMAIPWLLLSEAETHVSSSFAALLIAATPLVGAVLAAATKADDRLDRGRVIGLLIGFVGVAALVGLDVRAGDAWAVIAIALVAVGYASGPLILARDMSGVPGVGIAAVSLSIAAVGYLPWAVTRVPDHWPARSAIVSLVLLAVICTAVAFTVFFALIREVGPARSTVITYLNPVVAITLGLTIGNERFSAGMAVGFPLVLLGSYVATRKPRVAAPANEDELQPVTP